MKINIEKIKPAFLVVKRIFPYWKAELSILLICVGSIMFVRMVDFSGTTADHIVAMDNTFVLDNFNKEVYKEQESQFSINNPDKENPVITADVKKYDTSEMCFIGGQRFHKIKEVILSDSQFVTDENANLSWFNSTAKTQVASLGEKANMCVVSLGLNDLENVDKYVETLNQWSEGSDKGFVFVTIGYVNETMSNGITNQQIESFNNTMKEKLNKNWKIVDLYQYTKEKAMIPTSQFDYEIDHLANIFAWLISEISNQTFNN